MNLYEINQQQQELNNLLEESCGELTPELEAALEMNMDNFTLKAENYVRAMKNYKAEADAISEEIKRLQEKKKVCENAVTRMKTALCDSMGTFGLPKVQAGLFKITRTSNTSVKILDEDAIPQEYKKVKYEVSKTAIKSAINEGKEVAGAELEETHSITIR